MLAADGHRFIQIMEESLPTVIFAPKPKEKEILIRNLTTYWMTFLVFDLLILSNNSQLKDKNA